MRRTFPVLFFILLTGFPGLLSARSDHVYSLLFDEIRVQQQVGAGFAFHERREDDDVYQKTRQVYVAGEWAVVPWFSVYLKVPYADIVGTDRGKVDYWDHIRVGLKWEASWQTFGFVGGLYGDFARGHNKVGDVAHDIGYLEPYAGLFWDIDRFYVTTAIRWKTETNPKFREGANEDFRRRWFYDLSAGIRFQPFTLSLDLRYHHLYDPENQRKKYLEMAPGLTWHLGSGFHISAAAVFYTASESKNHGALISFRKFID